MTFHVPDAMTFGTVHAVASRRENIAGEVYHVLAHPSWHHADAMPSRDAVAIGAISTRSQELPTFRPDRRCLVAYCRLGMTDCVDGGILPR